jgi:hypothetical protein
MQQNNGALSPNTSKTMDASGLPPYFWTNAELDNNNNNNSNKIAAAAAAAEAELVPVLQFLINVIITVMREEYKDRAGDITLALLDSWEQRWKEVQTFVNNNNKNLKSSRRNDDDDDDKRFIQSLVANDIRAFRVERRNKRASNREQLPPAAAAS